VLHGGGTTFVFRLREETGARPSDIARAYSVAREVFGMRPQWAEIEALDNRVPAEEQLQMLLEGRRLVERATRWFLRNRRQPLAIAEAVSQFVSGATAGAPGRARHSATTCTRCTASSQARSCEAAWTWTRGWPRTPRPSATWPRSPTCGSGGRMT